MDELFVPRRYPLLLCYLVFAFDRNGDMFRSALFPVCSPHRGRSNSPSPFGWTHIHNRTIHDKLVYIRRRIFLFGIGNCGKQYFLNRAGCSLLSEAENCQSFLNIFPANKVNDQTGLLR